MDVLVCDANANVSMRWCTSVCVWHVCCRPMMSQLQVSHSQVTWQGVLVAKQQAGRKPKGLRNRDEQSQRCVCERAREGGREGEGRPTDKSCFCRHHSLLSQVTTFTAASCRSLSLAPPSFSPSSAVCLSHSKTPRLSFPLFTFSVLIAKHPSPPKMHTSSSICHTELQTLLEEIGNVRLQ